MNLRTLRFECFSHLACLQHSSSAFFSEADHQGCVTIHIIKNQDTEDCQAS